jgi:hypothetical protein
VCQKHFLCRVVSWHQRASAGCRTRFSDSANSPRMHSCHPSAISRTPLQDLRVPTWAETHQLLIVARALPLQKIRNDAHDVFLRRCVLCARREHFPEGDSIMDPRHFSKTQPGHPRCSGPPPPLSSTPAPKRAQKSLEMQASRYARRTADHP